MQIDEEGKGFQGGFLRLYLTLITSYSGFEPYHKI
jgi:hypothetical protein